MLLFVYEASIITELRFGLRRCNAHINLIKRPQVLRCTVRLNKGASVCQRGGYVDVFSESARQVKSQPALKAEILIAPYGDSSGYTSAPLQSGDGA